MTHVSPWLVYAPILILFGTIVFYQHVFKNAVLKDVVLNLGMVIASAITTFVYVYHPLPLLGHTLPVMLLSVLWICVVILVVSTLVEHKVL